MVSRLPDKAIEEYRTAYKEAYGEDISREKAEQEAKKLLNLLYIFTNMQENINIEILKSTNEDI